MPASLPVLINRSGGTAAALGERLGDVVGSAFAGTGRSIALELLDSEEMSDALRRHVGAPVIVVGGGDGTLGAAATVLANSTSALAILPMGTRNHLAQQLGVPLDLGEAAQLAVTGQRRRIDLGTAGERLFVNNASFGLYTRFVREREQASWPRWHGSARAAWHVVRNMRAQYFSLRIDGKPRAVASPLLFIGNNEYLLSAGHLGDRESLTGHQLSIFAIAAKRPWQLAMLALRAVLGLASGSRDFVECGRAREIVIEGRGTIEGAFDGEVTTLPLPLRLHTLPNALGIVTPRENAVSERTLSPIH